MAPLSFCNQRLLGFFAMEATTTVWLTKPMAPQDAESVAVMRWAIEEDAAREGSLAGECLAAARAAGLSAEDTYVFRSEEHTSELQSRVDLVCRLLLEKKK